VTNSAVTLQVINFSMSLRKVLAIGCQNAVFTVQQVVTLISVAALCSWLPLTPQKLLVGYAT